MWIFSVRVPIPIETVIILWTCVIIETCKHPIPFKQLIILRLEVRFSGCDWCYILDNSKRQVLRIFLHTHALLLVTLNIRTDTMALIYHKPGTTCGSTSLRLRILWSLRPQQQELLREVLPKPSSLMRIEAGASGDSKDFLVSLQTNSYIKHLKTGSPKNMSQKMKGII